MNHESSSEKCECGHFNPPGTILCEACGKPLVAEQENDQFSMDLLRKEMRYEGRARRSQVHKRTVVDHIWNFFSSVKIAVYLIIIALVASIIGTILPQEQYLKPGQVAETFYGETYGVIGDIYYFLGFHDLYDSWWYVAILLMIGISLIICSLDRMIPLYKALNKQRPRRHVLFLQRQRIAASSPVTTEEGLELLTAAKEQLRKKGYRIREDEGALLAEKNRFSRWGPYVNHVGLIIFLVGVLLGVIPGFYLDEGMWLRKGEVKAIPGTDYYLQNNQFSLEFYQPDELPEELPNVNPSTIAKAYQTDATLYYAPIPGDMKALQPVMEEPIEVNHPLKYEDLIIYQSSYQQYIEAYNLEILDGETEQSIGQFSLSLYNPQEVIKVNDQVSLKLLKYFPDYVISDGIPKTVSPYPNNPLFILQLTTPDRPEGEVIMVTNEPGPFISLIDTPRYAITQHKPDVEWMTGLKIRIDKRIPFVVVGATLVMVGLIMGFYWQHRRIWLQLQDGQIYLAGFTNKNWFGFRREVEDLLTKAKLPFDPLNIERGGKQE
ncbi:cytochrome c biogenesis protein ResB [Rubeoparvulum massiliense]|uniref:cytochrome c biogenesis protein ResB n=1 Tax=Rubeoparvulum massiliense TaxID=1631346 RepID=UPI00065E3AB1|nr:cytochrome c biogenesis protein ResB [Rubeoparvulum massiliense]